MNLNVYLSSTITTSGVILGKSTPLSLNFLFGGVGTIIPTPVFLPGESQGWGSWWAAIYGVAQSGGHD